MGRGADALERLRKALIAQEAARQDVQKAICDIKQMGGEVLSTQDEDTPETPEEIRGRRLVGWSMAAKDLEPVLAYARAGYRVLTINDAGKIAWDVISELMEQRYEEIERGE